jgi:hypothetical protein
MGSWREVEEVAPELAAAVRDAMDAHLHKVLATVRADGSPRVSGTEVVFHDGEVWLGSMPHSRKAADLRRDPRLAVHSATVDPKLVHGDAKIAGRARLVTDPVDLARFLERFGEEHTESPPGSFDLFVVDVSEIARTTVDEEAGLLIVEWWREGEPVRRVERS